MDNSNVIGGEPLTPSDLHLLRRLVRRELEFLERRTVVTERLYRLISSEARAVAHGAQELQNGPAVK